MDESNLTARLLPTALISSFIGRARPGDLSDPDPARRASAWAHWSVSNLAQMQGSSEREYAALLLPGRFYDPKGKLPHVKPHLEIPAHALDKADPEFPDRLAQMGNGLAFVWWVTQEVTAVRRALFNHPGGSIGEFVESLNDRRLSLVDALTQASQVVASEWSSIEEKLVSDLPALNDDATGDFETDDIKDFFPPAEQFKLRIGYEPRLKESSKQWAARRVGVWQITGVSETGESFSLGVITPRLTTNSLFKDPLFMPDKESPAALLVRSLLLRRIARNQLGALVAGSVVPSASVKVPGGPYLRAVVAKMGAKMPQASPDAAVRFLQAYPDVDNAWTALTNWASSTYLLTVSKEGFSAAHKNALRFIRRGEEPQRDDIDVVLPLAWDQGPSPRVVRVTFSRPQNDD